MRLSFSTGTLYHFPLRTTFALAHEAGFEGVELVLGPEVLLRGASYVRRLGREYSLDVLSVHPPVVPYPGHNNVVRILPRLISLAEQVHCDLVVLHPPKTSKTEDAVWKEFVQALLHERSTTTVRVSLENASIFRDSNIHYILHDIRRLLAFADCHDLPLTFDTAHVGSSGRDLLEAYALLARRVVNVHFSDFLKRRIVPDWPPLHTFFCHHQMPGEGVLPLADFLRTLLASDYCGVFTLELSPVAIKAWSPSLVRERLVTAVRYVRQLLVC